MEYPPSGMPGGGVMSMETAPAVGVPAAGGLSTTGCATTISRVRAHPAAPRATANSRNIRIVTIPSKASGHIEVSRTTDSAHSVTGTTYGII
jgi:hypothetical protein